MVEELDDTLNENKKNVYDFMLEGTGLVNSILSASLAIAGYKVLHIDKNDYYGSDQATLSLDQFLSIEPNDGIVEIGGIQFEQRVHSPELWNKIANDRYLVRQFNLDLDPRYVLCRGEVVDAIVRCGIADYLEFKAMEDTFMFDVDQSVVRVPCSKSAVFKSTHLSMIEKRQLMRFLQYCMDLDTVKTHGSVAMRNEASLNQGRSLVRPQNKSVGKETMVLPNEANFESYLTNQSKLSTKLKHSVLYSVALLPGPPEDLDAMSGFVRVQRYLGALGRFGKTAFIASSYGTSELTQAFCRLSSVYGSVFMLRSTIAESPQYDTNEHMSNIILTNGESAFVKHRISEYKESGLDDGSGLFLCRKAFIVDGPIIALAAGGTLEELDQLFQGSAFNGHPSDKRVFPEGARCLMQFPPANCHLMNPYVVHAVQVDNGLDSAAPGYFVIHMSTLHTDIHLGLMTLEYAMRLVLLKANEVCLALKEKSISMLWEVSFSKRYVSDICLKKPESNASIVRIPDAEFSIDTSDAMTKAKVLFEQYSDKEFLPDISDRKRATVNEEDDIAARVRVPQPVDLRYFTYLGGQLNLNQIHKLVF